MEALWVPLYHSLRRKMEDVLPDFPGKIKAVEINSFLKNRGRYSVKKKDTL